MGGSVAIGGRGVGAVILANDDESRGADGQDQNECKRFHTHDVTPGRDRKTITINATLTFKYR